VAGDRRLNGHLAPGNEAEAVFLSTETDLETGGGRVVWRALQDLEIRAEWDAGGVDPHQALVLPQACGNLPAGTVMVALGGVCQQLETGRSKPMQGRPLQSSLVALEPELGRMLGRWRLSDPWLSIRHLAWDALSGRLGVALQSEHPDPLVRAQAPVLAVWQGTGWEMAVDQPPLMGYAGGIEACPGGGFVVSCPRGNALAWFDAAARWQRSRRLDRACPLAWVDQQLWAGGGAHAHSLSPAADARRVAGPARLGELQFDNHWVRCL
jgi:hypothetical protein